MSYRVRALVVAVAVLGAGLWLTEAQAPSATSPAKAMNAHAVVPATPIARTDPDHHGGRLPSLLPVALLIAGLALSIRRPAPRHRRDGRGLALGSISVRVAGSRAPPRLLAR